MLGIMIIALMILMCCWCSGCFKSISTYFAKKPIPQEKNQLPWSIVKSEYPRKEILIPSYTIPINDSPILSEDIYDSMPESINSTTSSSLSLKRDYISEPESPKVDFRSKQKPINIKLGSFECMRCERCWTSVHSSKDCFQKCIKCRRKVYPYMLTTVKKTAGNRIQKKPHPKHLCEICTLYGDCRLIKK